MVKYVLFSLIATCFFLSCTLNTTANKSEATAPKCDSLLLNTEQMVNDTLWQFGSHCEFVLKDSASAYLYYKQSANISSALHTTGAMAYLKTAPRRLSCIFALPNWGTPKLNIRLLHATNRASALNRILIGLCTGTRSQQNRVGPMP